MVFFAIPVPVLMAAAVVLHSGCTPLASWFKSSEHQNTAQSASERPLVSNAFAYARFVALNLSAAPRQEAWTDESLRKVLKDNAEQSGISSSDVTAYLGVKAQPTGKGTTTQRIEDFRAQVNACVEATANTREKCCRALAMPLAIAAESESRFSALGMKAWLSICHSVVTQQPASLEEFMKSSWFKPNSEITWTQALHAKSRAKRGPRRILRRSDGRVSLAETLKPKDCSVLETEIIIRRPDGALNFWVYDAAGKPTDISHFPPPVVANVESFETIEKPSPDSCMGCHYDLKTREFNVLFPSARELNLPSTQDLPVICQRPGELLAEDN